MEQVLDGLLAALHVVLAAMFAMAPGMIVWTVVMSVVLVARRVAHSGPFQRFQDRGQAA